MPSAWTAPTVQLLSYPAEVWTAAQPSSNRLGPTKSDLVGPDPTRWPSVARRGGGQETRATCLGDGDKNSLFRTRTIRDPASCVNREDALSQGVTFGRLFKICLPGDRNISIEIINIQGCPDAAVSRRNH